MKQLGNTDFISAIAFIIFGAAFAGYASLTMQLGSFASMGAGMFPFLTGVIIASLGALQVMSMLIRRAPPVTQDDIGPMPPDWRSFAIVISALAVFALLVAPFGLAPAILTMTLIASLASEKLKLHVALLLGLGLLAVAYGVFVKALGLSLTMIDWPF